MQGTIGTASVTWEIQGDPENDVVATTGAVTFTPGALQANLIISVRGDTVPELDKTYTVVLTAASLVSVYIREGGGK